MPLFLYALTPLIVPCPVALTELPSLDDMLRRSTALSPEHEQLVRSFLDQCESYRTSHLADELVRLHGFIFNEGLSIPDRKEVTENIRSCMQESRKVEQLIKAYQPLLSSMRYVPPEIWISIFRLCMPNPYQQDLETNLPTSPVYLSSVCSRWRRIVQNDPFLWSIIRISFPRKPYGWLHTSTHVSNSGTTPLHVYVSSENNHANKDDISLITEFITSTAHRWRTLHFSVGFYSVAKRPFRDAHMPALDYLVVKSVPTWWTNPPVEPRTPNLRHLVFSPLFQSQINVLDVNSPLLTEMDVSCFLPTEFFNHFFPRHPKLVRLKTTLPSGVLQSLPQGPHMDMVFLEHLQVLQIILPLNEFGWNLQYTENQVIPFLRCFSLPSLRHLELLNEGRGIEIFKGFDLLVDYLATLQPPLHSLSLCGFRTILPPQSELYAKTKGSLQVLRCPTKSGLPSPNLLNGAI